MDNTEETPDGNEASAKLVGAAIMTNEEDNVTLTSDLNDFENRNLHLVKRPEKVEGKDVVNFLE